MVRSVFTATILICVIACTKPVQAGRNDSCDMIETLVALPGVLASLRAGQGEAREFKRNLARSLSILGDHRRHAVFSNAEVRTMRIFAGAVRKDWKLNGTSPDGRQIPGLTSTSTTIQNQLTKITKKFGCQIAGSGGGSPLQGTGDPPFSPLTLLLTVVSMVLAALSIYRLIRARYQVERRMCNMPALLRYDGICTATTMLDLSQGGAMVEAPDEAFPTDEVTLHLPGLSLPSRIAWTNKNFAGLSFDKRLSARRVEKIANMVADSNLPENLTDDAPDCFEPGCHLQCKTHRFTTQSLQNAAVSEA